MIWHSLVSILPHQKLYMRNLKGKTHTKKRVQYDVFNKLLIRETRDSPLKLANFSYQCTQHIWNVEYDRLCENLNEVITILGFQMFICPYDLWNRTILIQNIALNITCLHLNNTSYIIFTNNDIWFNIINTTQLQYVIYHSAKLCTFMCSLVQYNFRMINGIYH